MLALRYDNLNKAVILSGGKEPGPLDNTILFPVTTAWPVRCGQSLP